MLSSNALSLHFLKVDFLNELQVMLIIKMFSNIYLSLPGQLLNLSTMYYLL